MPFVGLFVRAFECLPVYRAVDGADPAQNRSMMAKATELLGRGNALSIFPEGTSHSDPSLKKFRSGAARIALSSRALSNKPVWIVPAALYYEQKETFRSRAVLAFGTPIEVPLTDLDPSGNSSIETGTALTGEIATAVEALMPTAQSAEGLLLAEYSERLFTASIRDSKDQCPIAAKMAQLPPERPALVHRMRLRRRLIDAYRVIASEQPALAEEIVHRVELIRDELEQHRLPIDAPPVGPHSLRPSLLVSIVFALLLSPFALVGFLTHAPIYYLVRFIAFRVSFNSNDIAATVKLVAGLLLFPLTWLALSGFVAFSCRPSFALVTLLLLPIVGWSTLLFSQILEGAIRSFRLNRGASNVRIDWDSLTLRRAALAEEIARLVLASEVKAETLKGKPLDNKPSSVI